MDESGDNKFSFTAVLPSGEEETFRVPKFYTVDQVKNYIFKKSSNSIRNLPKQHVLCAYESGAALDVEFRRFLLCHQEIENAVSEGKEIKVRLKGTSRGWKVLRRSIGLLSAMRRSQHRSSSSKPSPQKSEGHVVGNFVSQSALQDVQPECSDGPNTTSRDSQAMTAAVPSDLPVLPLFNVVTKNAREVEGDTALEYAAGEVVSVLKVDEANGQWFGRINDRFGWFPASDATMDRSASLLDESPGALQDMPAGQERGEAAEYKHDSIPSAGVDVEEKVAPIESVSNMSLSDNAESQAHDGPDAPANVDSDPHGSDATENASSALSGESEKVDADDATNQEQPRLLSRKGRTASIIIDGLTGQEARSSNALEGMLAVRFIMPNGTSMSIRLFEDETLAAVKETVVERARDRGKLPASNMNSEYFCFRASSSGENLWNESVALKDVIGPSEQSKVHIPQLYLIDRISSSREDFSLHMGTLLDAVIRPSEEVDAFRSEMARWRRQGGLSIDSNDYPMYITELPVPDNMSTVLLKVLFHGVEGRVSKMMAAKVDDPADSVIRQAMNRMKSQFPPDFNTDGYEWKFKATGRYEYLYGNHAIVDFEHVREHLSSRGVPVKLQYFKKKDTQPEPADSLRRFSTLVDLETLQKAKSGNKGIRSPLSSPTAKGSPDLDAIAESEAPFKTIAEAGTGVPFRIRLQDLHFTGENVLSGSMGEPLEFLWAEVSLVFGGKGLGPVFRTSQKPASSVLVISQWLELEVELSQVPVGTRVCIGVYGCSNKSKRVSIGYVAIQVFKFNGLLRNGEMSCRLWPGDVNPIAICGQNHTSDVPCQVDVQFPNFGMDVYADLDEELIDTEGNEEEDLEINPDVQARLDELLLKDPLYELSDQDKALLWNNRFHCMKFSKALPKFLSAVNWGNMMEAKTARAMVLEWEPVSKPADCLELLDSQISDISIREFAVRQLEELDDVELMLYLLQLVQALKYEPFHDSALARFLLERALRNRRVGHALFWFLKAEMHVPNIMERYGLLIEAYLHGCGQFRKELFLENSVLADLTAVANLIKSTPKEARLHTLREELRNVKFPQKFHLPLNFKWQAKGLRVDKCRFMDSKKLPLWLVFENADEDGDPLLVMFKCGDDLRQDILTLQMISIMDQIWKENGFDLRMKPYSCVATGDEIGMLEIVLNSETVANIQREAGGARGAFKEEPMLEWMKANKAPDQKFEDLIENFKRSLAGYCVATYVLGIGDRHNDNIMVTREGHFFHIDFGHFLGNIKRKLGVKRERAPFVFTPDLAYVMGKKGSEGYREFEIRGCEIYNILRQNASTFFNLFSLMLSTGLPELQQLSDLLYLREVFDIELSTNQAASKWRSLVEESLNCKTTQANFAIHILAH